MNMLTPTTWEEFRAAGLLWWVNRQLHLFGYAITAEVEDESGQISRVYPARCRFRGFGASAEDDGFRRLTAHLAEGIDALLLDAEITSPPSHQKPGPAEIMAAAGAIANARAGRRGAPAITNVLDLLPRELLAELMEDARAALLAAREAQSR